MNTGSHARSSEEVVTEPAPELRVLLVAYRFPPQGGGGVQRPSKMIKYLMRSGVPCAVLMGPEDWRLRDDTLLAEHAPDLLRRATEHTSLGQTLVDLRDRLPRLPGRGVQGVLWLLHSLAVPDATFDWYPPAVREGQRLIDQFRPNVLLVTGPPWTPTLVARSLARRNGIPWVMDYRDPWTLSHERVEESRIIRAVNRRLEPRVLASADGILAAHRFILERVRPHVRPDALRLFVPNGFDREDVPAEPLPPLDPDRFVLGYTGSFFARRLPRTLFQVLEELLATGRIDPDRFRFRFAGSLGRARPLLAETPHLREVFEDEGYLTHPESVARLRTSHLNLVFQSDGSRNYTTPGKFYEALRIGRTILLLCPPGPTPHLGRFTGGCRIAGPDDAEAIRRHLLESYDAWREGLPAAAPDPHRIRFYDRAHQADRVGRFLSRIVRRHGSGR